MDPANRYELSEGTRNTQYAFPAQRAESALPDSYPGMPAAETMPQSKGLGHAARELVETILLTLVIFFMIRFAIENYKIDGFSMEPNFHDGQFLLVNKISYLLGHPQRGDVIIFRFPGDLTKNYIKRVIGLPGERVEIRAGKVFVNGVRVQEPQPYNFADYDWGPVTIGPDEYFVLGDNRPESSDSHSWGMLPARDIIGKAWLSYWPPNEWGAVQEYSYAAAP